MYNYRMIPRKVTAYQENFPNLSPPSQGPSSYWGRSDSDSQCSSSVPDSEIDIEEQLLLNMLDSLYNVYMAKVLAVTIGTQQRWRMLCPDCKEWVQTSVSSQLPLWHPGQFSSLSNHRGSRKCIKASTDKTKPMFVRTVSDAPLSRSLSLTSEHRPCRVLSPVLNSVCTGVPVVWPEDLRPFIMLFPWERYHDGPDALPFLVGTRNPSALRLRSKRCLSHGTPCDECAEIPLHVEHLADIAPIPKAHTNYKFLGLAHMQDIARTYAEQIKQLKLQLNDSRKYMSVLTQLDDYNRLLMAVSEQDIPRLQQIINVALRNGASIRQVVNKLEDALEGAYHPRGYDANDLDIATLVYRLGGHQLLFALIVLSGCTDSVLCGVSLMIDEIALEEMAVHFSKYNKVGGLCWKHSHTIDPVLRTYESAVYIAQKIHDGHVHLGKELTVMGALCFGRDEIFPILAAPTCKTENTNDMEQILAKAISRWNSTGAAVQIGPVWLFVKSPLSEGSDLYGTLINMPGLNLFTGNNEVTLDFDFKHIFKRDPQDVPRAVELVLAVIEFSNSQHSIMNDSFSTDIDTRADLQSIALLSALLESILLPFTDVSLSLSEQFVLLSQYSHLTFAFFHAHRRSFMSYQLYYDTQTMVKNLVFCLAKQQTLDPYAPFFLGDVGDDPLEILFGRMCMIGGHNSTSSYAQALDRLGAAKDIDGVFRHHPELDSGHRRLKLTCQEGVDHINREIWKGNIISGRCDLPMAWHSGCDTALSILATSQLEPTHYSFAELFSVPGIDMLRPFGQNRYLGITTDNDLEDTSEVPSMPPPVAITPLSQCLETVLAHDHDHSVPDPEVSVGGDDDKEIMLTFQEALIDESSTDTPAPSSSSQHIPRDPSTPALPQGPGIHPDDYLLYKGRWIHKQTICRLVINKDFISKSLNCLEHVCGGYTKVNKRVDVSAGRITDPNLFLVGDIFLTVLHSGRTLSIGVLRSTAVSLNNISRASINVTIMKALRNTAKITGQLLSLVATDPSPDSSQSFLWDGGYIKAHSIIQGTLEHTEHVVMVTVPGSLVEPVNPEATFIRLRDDVNTDKFTQVHGSQSTWKISQDIMQAACELLWAKANELKVTLKSIAVIIPSDPNMFPYRLPDGTPAVISVEASNQLTASKGERITTCPLCDTKVIDMSVFQVPVVFVVVLEHPSALSQSQYLAAEHLPGKRSAYTSTHSGSKKKPCHNLPLKCELCHPVLPPQPSKTMRKVPILPVESVWRYNMIAHILDQHEEYTVPGHREAGVPLPVSIWRTMKLTDLEQGASRIPKDRWQPSYSGSSEREKENVPVASGSRTKRPAIESAGSLLSKRARTSLQHSTSH
ncbi:uncharacterized protein F5147DRAFT_649104 [Suillus discolor]|uniref:Uncharacterized protein n=1 Tax=Suillus discolor TaxID=1912936 RepID=A0A9P7JYP6_9AGAM|nr:uncharacterized protein F5147DRAFT_649104 [Suillus discolor]KAG2116646.1 hypothetical protein F5147DRAFT_649104 [Suillus discolor]